MSDLMLRGVILMPYNMAMRDELSRRQFYSRAQALLADYDRMRDALTQAKKWISRDEHGGECRGEGIFCCCGKYDLEKAISAALAQEQGGSDGD